MIDFKICRECKFGKWQEPQHDTHGNIVVMPSVECSLNNDILLMNSLPPSDCPDRLFHKMATQVVPKRFANHMSGER